jgi:phosphatidylethanolamine/phosphatidyl-N-methylethanolamine N-methyltransferase
MEIKYDYEKYSKYMYTGMQGAAMLISHKLLNQGIPKELNRSILDIGGGSMPHKSIIEINSNDSYCISDTSSVLSKKKQEILKTQYENYEFHIWDKDKNFNQFTGEGRKFTRIIASHVWEHVDNPEFALKLWASLLEDDGIITIAIPCDPGLVWRLGQLISRRKARKLFGLEYSEYDLQMSREHVNPAQNLVKIFKYYAPRGSKKLFPFVFPIIEFNLFCILIARKSEFIDM